MEPNIEATDRDLELDLKDLAPAVARQSSLYDYYGQLAADARANRDTAVNKLDRRTAEVELEIRKAATAAGEKLTEAKVSAMVDADPELNSLKADVVEKNRELQHLETKVRALDHKRVMIDVAARLICSKSMNLSMDGAGAEFAAEESQSAIRHALNRGSLD